MPNTDRNIDEFAASWTQNVKGATIQCYGPSQDNATVIVWGVDDDTYCVTFQGYGGEEMTMDPDDVSSLVNGIQ